MKSVYRSIALASLSIVMFPAVLPAYASPAKQADVLIQEQAALDTVKATPGTVKAAPGSSHSEDKNPVPGSSTNDGSDGGSSTAVPTAASQAEQSSAQRTRMLNGFVSRQNSRPTGDVSDSAPAVTTEGDSTLNIQMKMQQTVSLRDLMRFAATIRRGQHITLHGTGNGPVTLRLGAEEFPMSMGTPRYSSEEFRKMEYGVTCMSSRIQVGEMAGPPVVISVVPGGPAETSGIKVGDILVKANDHLFQSGENQRTAWNVFAGKAGTPIDITVLRNGELIKFKVVRMNIEDIPDQNMRVMYERLLSVMGPPRYNEDGSVDRSQSESNHFSSDNNAH